MAGLLNGSIGVAWQEIYEGLFVSSVALVIAIVAMQLSCAYC